MRYKIQYKRLFLRFDYTERGHSCVCVPTYEYKDDVEKKLKELRMEEFNKNRKYTIVESD